MKAQKMTSLCKKKKKNKKTNKQYVEALFIVWIVFFN